MISYTPGPYPPCACTVRYVGAVCIDCDGTVDDHAAFQAGAAVAFGIVGMAEAIRLRVFRDRVGTRVCSRCGNKDYWLLCGGCQTELASPSRPVAPDEKRGTDAG
jgi:hypothetical protein